MLAVRLQRAYQALALPTSTRLPMTYGRAPFSADLSSVALNSWRFMMGRPYRARRRCRPTGGSVAAVALAWVTLRQKAMKLGGCISGTARALFSSRKSSTRIRVDPSCTPIFRRA